MNSCPNCSDLDLCSFRVMFYLQMLWLLIARIGLLIGIPIQSHPTSTLQACPSNFIHMYISKFKWVYVNYGGNGGYGGYGGNGGRKSVNYGGILPLPLYSTDFLPL